MLKIDKKTYLPLMEMKVLCMVNNVSVGSFNVDVPVFPTQFGFGSVEEALKKAIYDELKKEFGDS